MEKKLVVLVVGATGFAGSHLAEYALSKGAEVHGTTRWRSKLENLQEIKDIITLHECDINDAFAFQEVIKKVKPDYIFHLAAQSFVKASWTEPAQTLNTNIIGELNLFEAVRSIPNYKPRILIAGSSEEYGHQETGQTGLDEEYPLLPLSPYGVSKVAQDLLGFQYFKSYGMHIIRSRAFNHTGPRRGEVFVCSTFAKQIVEIEKDSKKLPIIKVGNLDAERDFTDVRDMVKGYWLALEKGEPGEVYNICSGVSIPIKNILRKLISMSKRPIEIKLDKERMRPSDLKVLLGNNKKFCDKTGWKPQIQIDKTLEDLLNYWRNKLNILPVSTPDETWMADV